MLTALTHPASAEAAALFAGLQEHLVLDSIFTGLTPAVVYVDDPAAPAAAFTWFKHRAFLGGAPGSPHFLNELRLLLNDQLIPGAQSGGVEGFVLHFHDPAWLLQLEQLLPGRAPIPAQRQYYVFRLPVGEPMSPAGIDLPDGYQAVNVDAALLGRSDLLHMDELRRETCSERLSVEDFLAHSFGACLLHDDELAAWCLSEYNCNRRCEVGVATVRPTSEAAWAPW